MNSHKSTCSCCLGYKASESELQFLTFYEILVLGGQFLIQKSLTIILYEMTASFLRDYGFHHSVSLVDAFFFLTQQDGPVWKMRWVTARAT